MNEETVYIPERFKKVMTLHIIKNVLEIPIVRAPLILGIHGPSGDGKTFQCESVLKELGVKRCLISGGQLESDKAGEPAKLIRQTYLQAGEAIRDGDGDELMAALLINDFDTGVGAWGEMVQYTVNRQAVFAELMHLADYPESVEKKQTLRIPIIITGNNFTSLHEPLTRTGRMWAFEWKPTLEEKSRIVKGIYPSLSKEDIYSLVKHFPNHPVAFFASLKMSLLDDYLWKEVTRVGERNIVHQIRTKQEFSYSEPIYDINNLLSEAKKVSEERLVDHLSPAKKVSKEELVADYPAQEGDNESRTENSSFRKFAGGKN
jgi:SpoVK/Ycf46/Vps4 family AAA+-type ATPase